MQDVQEGIAGPLAEIVTDFYVYFSMADDESLGRKEAAKMLTLLGERLAALDKEVLRGVLDQVPAITANYRDEQRSLILGMADAFDLEQRLAADEPPEAERDGDA